MTFNLTDEEKYLLLESDVGEGIFFVGLKHVAHPDPRLLYRRPDHHTNPAQVLQISSQEDLEEAQGGK